MKQTMKIIGRDVLIFALIAVPICVVFLNIDIKNGCVERKFCKIYFSSPVSRRKATEVADALVKTGVFADMGSPRLYIETFLELNDDGVYRLTFLAQRNYSDNVPRDYFESLVSQACNIALKGNRVNVWVADPHLEPFDELIETQLFDPSAATANYD